MADINGNNIYGVIPEPMDEPLNFGKNSEGNSLLKTS